jgi:hypothetical protein
MIADHKSRVSNDFAGSLVPLKGEKIKGSYTSFDMERQHEYRIILFESGYSFVFLNNGSYWIDDPEDTQRKLQSHFHRLTQIKENLQQLADLTGETL